MKQQVFMPNGHLVFESEDPRVFYSEETARRMWAAERPYKVMMDGKPWPDARGNTAETTAKGRPSATKDETIAPKKAVSEVPKATEKARKSERNNGAEKKKQATGKQKKGCSVEDFGEQMELF